MLRAGPLSDERVVRLANRRFVPFYFDLNNQGYVSDKDARSFVTKVRKELAGGGVPTPPVLFMTPAGEVVGEADNYAGAGKVLAKMKSVLEKNPDYAKPADGEAKDDPDVAFDLDRLDDARRLYEAKGDWYGVGKVARRQKDWEAMEKALAQVKDEKLADDVAMERAHRHWEERDFEKLRDACAKIEEASNRTTEARYYLGLAHYHLKDSAKALETWKAMIAKCSQDPFVYRADWAYCDVRDGGKNQYSSDAKGSSCLGRIGYMGARNPDLRKRKE